MALLIAFIVLAAGAALALRSAMPPQLAPTKESEVEPQPSDPEPAEVPAAPAIALEAPSLTEPDLADTQTAAVPVTAPATSQAFAVGPITITEDRDLDDVLQAGAEPEPDMSKAGLRLVVAIAGLSLAFAAALLAAVRGLQQLWSKAFG